jgi:hypothetical protein
VQDRALQLARETYSLGPDRAAARSGTNRPGIHNAVLVELSTTDCSVRAHHLVPARDPIAVAARGETFARLTYEELRLSRNGVETTIDLPGASPQALALSADGRSVLWARSGNAAEGVMIEIWSPDDQKARSVARLEAQSQVVHLRLDGGRAVAIETKGMVHSWPIETATAARLAPAQRLPADRIAREKAILALGLGDARAAAAALAAFPSKGTPNHFLAAYLRSLVDNEAEPAFVARLSREGIAYTGDPHTLRAVEHLASAELTPVAVDVLFYYLRDAKPGSLPERGATIGLELALQLSELDRDEGRAALLRELGTRYPCHAKVAEALAER